MSDGGKGSAPRPKSVDANTFASNWELAFGKKKPQEEMIDEGSSNLYVQYDSERKDEDPFMMHGEKWQYVNAIYPDGKKDIGVYRYGEDLVYSYDWFRKNIVGDKTMIDFAPLGLTISTSFKANFNLYLSLTSPIKYLIFEC